MKQHLDELTTYIEIYKSSEVNDDGNTLSECLKHITSALYFLEIERAKYHEKYQEIIHRLTLKGTPVNRAENEAHVLVPEMYQLRRIMDSAYTVVDSIRTQISWIKTGLKNS